MIAAQPPAFGEIQADMGIPTHDGDLLLQSTPEIWACLSTSLTVEPIRKTWMIAGIRKNRHPSGCGLQNLVSASRRRSASVGSTLLTVGPDSLGSCSAFLREAQPTYLAQFGSLGLGPPLSLDPIHCFLERYLPGDETILPGDHPDLHEAIFEKSANGSKGEAEYVAAGICMTNRLGYPSDLCSLYPVI